MNCNSGYSISGVCVSADKFQKSIAGIKEHVERSGPPSKLSTAIGTKLDTFILDKDLSLEELKYILNQDKILQTARRVPKREPVRGFFIDNMGLLFLQEQTHDVDYVIKLCKLGLIDGVIDYLSTERSYPNTLQDPKFKNYVSGQTKHLLEYDAARALLEANPEDTEFQRWIVHKEPALYNLANPEVKKDRELALAFVKDNYRNYEDLPTELKEDAEISDEYHDIAPRGGIFIGMDTGFVIHKDLAVVTPVLGITYSFAGPNHWGFGFTLLGTLPEEGPKSSNINISVSYSLLPNRTAHEFPFLDLRLAWPFGVKIQEEGGTDYVYPTTGLGLELTINPDIPYGDPVPLLKTGVKFLCTPPGDETLPCSIQIVFGLNFLTPIIAALSAAQS
ncbi:MAG: DUF4116 domain-containing protein [Deltaproteobacteria bacterium]|nr:DUF4116 domain-containing protein [Deltaproteobacteria bacterium]